MIFVYSSTLLMYKHDDTIFTKCLCKIVILFREHDVSLENTVYDAKCIRILLAELDCDH